jgi:hypothetical protein
MPAAREDAIRLVRLLHEHDATIKKPMLTCDIKAALGITTRRLAYAKKYARNHRVMVATHNRGPLSNMWLEDIVTLTEHMANTYLWTAFSALVSWYRGSSRIGGPQHRTLRTAISGVIGVIGGYLGMDDEQISVQKQSMTDPALEDILGR